MARGLGVCAKAALLTLGACATTRDGTTWEQDNAEGVQVAARYEPPQSSLLRRSVSLTNDAPARASDAEVGDRMELALLRFTSARRQAFVDHPEPNADEPVAWPQDLSAAFSAVLVTLEDGLARPAGGLPRRVLIQARVTLDVELDASARRYGPAPDAIAASVKKVFVQVALHMRAKPKASEEREPRELALRWPVSPLIVTSPFGYRRDPILGETEVRFHAGIDLAGVTGDVVYAAAPGRVVSTGWLGGHGRTVIVQHTGGYATMYCHLNDALVKAGSAVDTGSAIGLMGSSGRSTGTHLHFEIHKGGIPIDPADAVGFSSGGYAAN